VGYYYIIIILNYYLHFISALVSTKYTAPRTLMLFLKTFFVEPFVTVDSNSNSNSNSSNSTTCTWWTAVRRRRPVRIISASTSVYSARMASTMLSNPLISYTWTTTTTTWWLRSAYLLPSEPWTTCAQNSLLENAHHEASARPDSLSHKTRFKDALCHYSILLYSTLFCF